MKKKLVNGFITLTAIIAVICAILMHNDYHYMEVAPIFATSIVVLMVYLIGEASKND